MIFPSLKFNILFNIKRLPWWNVGLDLFSPGISIQRVLILRDSKCSKCLKCLRLVNTFTPLETVETKKSKTRDIITLNILYKITNWITGVTSRKFP